MIISTGEAYQNRQFFTEHKLGCSLLLQQEMEVATAYHAGGTPSGYLIHPDGRIASELALGGDALLKLAAGKTETGNPNPGPEPRVAGSPSGNNGDDRANRFSQRSLAGSKIKRDGLKACTPAPEFRLPLLEGGEFSLTGLRGRPVFLVFSSPHCAPCNALAPRLEKFHRQHPDLQVVMISRGEPQNRHKLNVLFLTYEELAADLEGCFRRIIAFCHLQVPSEKMPLIIERCRFAFMKQHENKFDPAVETLRHEGARLNLFFRAGRVGEGSRQLNRQQQTRFDQAFQSSRAIASIRPSGKTSLSRQ